MNIENKNNNRITKSYLAYECPACKQPVIGRLKYEEVEGESLPVGKTPESLDVKTKLVGAVVPEHNCIPPVTRSASSITRVEDQNTTLRRHRKSGY